MPFPKGVFGSDVGVDAGVGAGADGGVGVGMDASAGAGVDAGAALPVCRAVTDGPEQPKWRQQEQFKMFCYLHFRRGVCFWLR